MSSFISISVMAFRIPVLDTLSKTRSERQALYRDLALDTKPELISDSEFGRLLNTLELKGDINLEAIRNSLHNLFNTIPGQRFLWPDYGLDFYQFLFWPVTETNGGIIGDRLLRVISKYEPRVTVENIHVISDPDHSAYDITLTINIPTLGESIHEKYNFDIKNQSFVFVSSSRNT